MTEQRVDAPTAAHRVAALDGLRTMAVGVVLAQHAYVLAGGGIGVDLFLVLSGFLITTLLLDEYDAVGRIRIGMFYARRLLRLYPALIAVVVVTTTLCLTLDIEPFRRSLSGIGTSVAALLYLGDVAIGWGWWTGFTYDNQLNHTWSLSVEEHFYLAWAPLLLLLARRVSRRVTFGLLVATVAAMFAWTMLLAVGADVRVDRLRFAPDVRGIGLIVGCALALAVRLWPVRTPRWAPWAAVGAFLALATFSWVGRGGVWAAGFLATDLLCVVILLGAMDGGSAFARFWSSRALVAVGMRAYGIYLWHYPTFALVHYYSPWSHWPTVAVQAAVTTALVEASYRAIELPALRLRHRFQPRPEAGQGSRSRGESSPEVVQVDALGDGVGGVGA